MNTKNPRIHNKKHLAWIRTLPCILTGRPNVDAAHIRFSDAAYGKINPGVGAKPHDFWTLPLSRDMHDAQHRMNERKFWQYHGIDDPLKIALALYVNTGDDEAAAAILRENRKE